MVLKLIINVLHVMISKSIFIIIILIFFCVLRGGAGRGLLSGYSAICTNVAPLTLYILMDSSFWFDTISWGYSIAHTWVSGGNLKQTLYFCLKIFLP